MKIGIVTHYFFYGSCQALNDFLKKKVHRLTFIELPLDITLEFQKKPIRVTNKNNNIQNYYFYSRFKLLNYIVHFFICLYLQFNNFKNFDHIISSNPINCFATIILKKIINIKKISYFSIDYSSERFGNNYVLNLLYVYLDLFCYRFSDENWDISPTMLQGRKKNFRNLDQNYYRNKLKVVPVGTWNAVSHKKFSKKKLCLIFIGHFIERVGIFDLLNYLSHIDKNKYKAILLGGGSNFSNINNIVLKKKLNKNVKVIDWVDSKTMRKYLANADIGMALYQDCEHNYNCNPTKIVEYICSGLPIMTTSVNYLSKYLIKNNCALKVDNLTDFKNKFNLLYKKRKKLITLSKRVILISKDYCWNSIFTKAINI